MKPWIRSAIRLLGPVALAVSMMGVAYAQHPGISVEGNYFYNNGSGVTDLTCGSSCTTPEWCDPNLAPYNFDVDPGLNPNHLNDANLEFNLEPGAVTSLDQGTGQSRPLTGQAETSLNIGLFYDSHRQSMAFLWRDFGKRLSGLGLGTLPDVYEEPPASLDFRWRWRFGGGIAVQLSTKNLLNRTVKFIQGDKVVRSWTPGREFGLALGWSL